MEQQVLPYFQRNYYPIHNSIHDTIYNNTYILGFLCTMYLPTVFTLKNYMQNKQALRGGYHDKLFFLWNMFLSVSSGVGVVFLFPTVYDEFKTDENYGICTGTFRNHTVASYVVILFTFSKFFEFIDTLFVVTRKSQLEFIHWYHHIATCLYCWHSSHISSSSGHLFALMNLSVHAIMYFYYGLYAIGNKILHPYRKMITVIQISQMIGGCSIIYSWFIHCKSKSSQSEYMNMVFAMVMYFSYFVLFIKVFFREKVKSN